MGRVRRRHRSAGWKVGECLLHKRKYIYAEKWALARHNKMYHGEGV